jgi:Helix-turn-helix domain
MSAAAVARMPIREAYPGDVAKDKRLSNNEKLVYKVLAEHVFHPKKDKLNQPPYTGIAWLRRETICEEASLSDSTVRRAINKLLALNWICLPEGDAGGRRKGKGGKPNALKYHLHPDGCSCHLPKVPLKQREAASAKRPERASNCTPSFDSERASICSEKGVNLTAAYKETISSNTISSNSTTHAHAREPEPEKVAAVVVAETPQETKPTSPELPELEQPEVVEEIAKLEALVDDEIEPRKGIPRLLRAAKKHGFTLAQLRWAAQERGRWIKTAGGLITFAEKWAADALKRLETDRRRRKVTDCGAREQRSLSASKGEEDSEVCLYCRGTGRQPSQFCWCSKGRELEAEEMGWNLSDLAPLVNAGEVWKSSLANNPVA